MRERPIIFSASEVRAVLEGRKTQARRAVKPGSALDWQLCPLGQPGDRLWVREVFVYRSKHDRYYYRADHPKYDPYAHSGWRSPVCMSRRAARIDLEVTRVRVERLQDISETDAIAEGIQLRHPGDLNEEYGRLDYALVEYCTLWRSIHGPGSWAKNPWVWVVEFRRVKP